MVLDKGEIQPSYPGPFLGSLGTWFHVLNVQRYTMSKRCPGEMRRGVLADSKVLDTVAVSLRDLGGVWV